METGKTCWRIGFCLILAFALLPFSTAQESGVEVVWNSSNPGAEVPEQLEAGFTTFTEQNDEAEAAEAGPGYSLTLVRLNEGVTLEVYTPVYEAVDQAFATGGDTVAAINAALELSEIWGEAGGVIGGVQSLNVVLEEGNFVLIGNFAAEEGAVPENTYQPFEVVAAAEAAPAPEADVTVQMVDFAFALPPGIAGGEQTWEVVNPGQQIHHMVLWKLNEGATMDDLNAFMQNPEAGGPPPFEDAGYAGVLSAGRSEYVNLDLTPGTYVAICFMPDHLGDATGQPHFLLGMMQSFVIE